MTGPVPDNVWEQSPTASAVTAGHPYSKVLLLDFTGRMSIAVGELVLPGWDSYDESIATDEIRLVYDLMYDCGQGQRTFPECCSPCTLSIAR